MPRFNDNISYSSDGSMTCVHCSELLRAPGEPFLHRALVRTGDVGLAGPHVFTAAPRVVRDDIEFRQLLCPTCASALQTEVVPVADVAPRTARITGG